MDSVLNSICQKSPALLLTSRDALNISQPWTQWKDPLSRPFTSWAEGFACFHLYSQKMHDTQITTNATKNSFVCKK